MTEYFKNCDEIRSLVESFESCAIRPEDFRHYQHLTVALWYASSLSYAEMVEKMTSGIRHLSEAYGKTGYHETITIFWLRIVSDFAKGSEDDLPATANRLIEKYQKDHIREYYSPELLASDEAKAAWVEPDLKTLPAN